MLFALFAALNYGVERFPALGLFSEGGTEEMVASFFCWLVAMGAIGHTASELEEEAKQGTLEPVFTSAFRPSTVIAVRSISSSLGGLLLAVLTLLGIAWYSGAALEIGPQSLVALLVLDIGLSGVGLLMAGACVVVKRVSSVAPLLYLAFGVGIAATVSPEPVDAMLAYPILSALEIFARSLFDLPVTGSQIAAATGWSLACLVAGIVGFEKLAHVARMRGSLSHR